MSLLTTTSAPSTLPTSRGSVVINAGSLHAKPSKKPVRLSGNLASSTTLIQCEACKAFTHTLNLCWHCGRVVCQLCWTRDHQCLPTHELKECPSLELFMEYGEACIQSLRRNNGLQPLTEP